MINLDVPVYLVNGFLESGKTTFLKETVNDPEFARKYKTLLILCEEGEAEFSKQELKKLNIETAVLEKEADMNEKFLNQCDDFYQPDRVLIEYNGMWKQNAFLQLRLPKDWITAQVITIINAQTYHAYLANMRSIMLEQVKYSDTIIVNRCSESTDKTEIRRSIKPVNRKGQILYEALFGAAVDAGEDELPFDIHAEVLDICDDDYGLWYMDAMDHPKKYKGKTVVFTAMVYRSEKEPGNGFLSGRFAMTCCADDVAFMGFLCRVEKENKGPLGLPDLASRQYIELEAEIRCEYYKEYKGKGPVLYARSIKPAKEPAEPMIYFS